MSESANGPLDTRRGFLASLWAAVVGLFVVKVSVGPARSKSPHGLSRSIYLTSQTADDFQYGFGAVQGMAAQLAAHTREVERQAAAVRESAERVERLTP